MILLDTNDSNMRIRNIEPVNERSSKGSLFNEENIINSAIDKSKELENRKLLEM
jgi:hypothetical protein